MLEHAVEVFLDARGVDRAMGASLPCDTCEKSSDTGELEKPATT
jgi:hypothetical protein